MPESSVMERVMGIFKKRRRGRRAGDPSYSWTELFWYHTAYIVAISSLFWMMDDSYFNFQRVGEQYTGRVFAVVTGDNARETVGYRSRKTCRIKYEYVVDGRQYEVKELRNYVQRKCPPIGSKVQLAYDKNNPVNHYWGPLLASPKFSLLMGVLGTIASGFYLWWLQLLLRLKIRRKRRLRATQSADNKQRSTDKK